VTSGKRPTIPDTHVQKVREVLILGPGLDRVNTLRSRFISYHRGKIAPDLGFVTPIHGDMARGHGVEKEWD